MKRLYLFVAIFFLSLTQIVSQNQLQDSLFHNFQWRNIGPFRGGRSVACTGVVSKPHTYYMGTTGGGIWKTTDDGITWKNISDGQLKTGTVGAIAVSESNPNVIVVGMGEHPARGVMTSMGDGVYKSTDAGKTWKHIGLSKSYHISDVIIDPTNENNIFVSVQGAQYGPTTERGIYRSTNGGETWERVLYVDDRTGASALTMDMNNPKILYAGMWEHRRYPWTMVSGGKSSGIYKSVDGGTTWQKLTEGLPKVMGKMGLSVSRANSDIVYAVIEAEGDKAGVYKSVDAGKKWRQTSKDRKNITRSWYYMEIFADPVDENVVYVQNAPMTKSIDGGRTFRRVPTPHGDNHDMWIHPKNNQIMINSNDGGANVSNNGGKSWSSQSNQSTSQFYRVITDNLVPYNVYGGQQDNSAIRIKSRTSSGGISNSDFESVAGCESAYLAFDPDNPEIVYGGCYQGIISKWIEKTKHRKNIKEYPELGLGGVPKDFKYRYNWNAPIISSPHNRKTIYHTGNVVFKTTDEGQTWEKISPDLTRNDKAKQGKGGSPFTNEAAGGENYNTIMYLTASPHQKGVLWAGTDDGLVHITKNEGKNWENVTPKGLQESIINSIEVSPHDPATAYIVAMRYKFQDLKPYIYKTSDYGKSWKKITNGITDPNTFVRVVREDKKRKGLLYAGTETGMYISFNDGRNWQPLNLNLPAIPINDLTIQDNDLVIATAGRGFWILDDISPLQQYNASNRESKIFKPKDTYLLFGGGSFKSNGRMGQNPPQGVLFDYYLPSVNDSTKVSVKVYQNGKLIRTLSNEKKKFKRWEGGPPKPDMLPAKQGFNRYVWNFRKETLPAIDKVFSYGNYQGSPVAPGNYDLELSVDGKTSKTSVTILPNPNFKNTDSEVAEQQQMLDNIETAIKEIHTSVTKMRGAKKQLSQHKKLLSKNENAKELLKKGSEISKKINDWERMLIQPDQKTFQDVINQINKLGAHFMHLKGFVEGPEAKVTGGAKERYADLIAKWNVQKTAQEKIINLDMAQYNNLYKSLNLPAIIMN